MGDFADALLMGSKWHKARVCIGSLLTQAVIDVVEFSLLCSMDRHACLPKQIPLPCIERRDEIKASAMARHWWVHQTSLSVKLSHCFDIHFGAINFVELLTKSFRLDATRVPCKFIDACLRSRHCEASLGPPITHAARRTSILPAPLSPLKGTERPFISNQINQTGLDLSINAQLPISKNAVLGLPGRCRFYFEVGWAAQAPGIFTPPFFCC